MTQMVEKGSGSGADGKEDRWNLREEVRPEKEVAGWN